MAAPVLFRDFMQLGYVVRDMEAAMQAMRGKYGVEHWKVRKLPPTAPAHILAFAYVGGMMIELIEVRPGEDTIYHSWIPEARDGARLHHLGYLLEEKSDWDARIAQYENSGFSPAIFGEVPGVMDWYYSDTVDMLGHYVELIRFTTEAGKAYWADVPEN